MKNPIPDILKWLDGFEEPARDLNGLLIMVAILVLLVGVVMCQMKKRLAWKRSKARKPCS